ncbi:von Willebrand factor type A domain containing protein [Nitzschia inconspicua]|uniref:von Willebrand factor type A domain containing protein n=1 Tax=Nitzschia inconspicua TaxID=303405 RepID=A0A9K3L0N4_9STRA|nr:von Willebrand factor type A domain containing protein [Nitzschia inconspicua]
MQAPDRSEFDERELLDPPAEKVVGQVHEIPSEENQDFSVDIGKADMAHLFIKATETGDTDMLSEEDAGTTPRVFSRESIEWCTGDEGSPGEEGLWQVLENVGEKQDAEIMDGGDDVMSIISSETSLDEFSFGSETESQQSDLNEGQILQCSSGPRAFNMHLLMSCIKSGENALKDVVGQDVIAVVGKTGTGKSTLIQGIAGKTFRETCHETLKYSESAKKRVFEPADPLVGFEIGHSNSSMTKSLNCFVRQRKTGSIVYVDTPGFEDTEGPEVDVVTSVMLNQVALKSRSLRLIVMVNYHSLLDDRGGSIRSILKFIRKFASGSFKDDQKSFMFLFTHTNEISSCPEDNAGAKRHLLNEIIRTIDGTKDEEILDVLKFIRICLQKKYPFVDIVNPLTTDFNDLASFVEGKQLKPLKNGQGAPFCGLTSAAQMKLGVHALELVNEMGSLLKSKRVDTLRLKEIQSVFCCFEKHFCFGEIQRSIDVYKEIIRNKITEFQSIFQLELENGTSTSSNKSFTETNVALLKEKLHLLEVLSDEFPIQMVSDDIVGKVCAFYKAAFVDSLEGYCGISLKLKKLQAWQNFDHPVTAGLYTDAIQCLIASFEQAKRSVEAFDVLKCRNSDAYAAVLDFFKQMRALKTLSDSSSILSRHGLDVSAVAKLLISKLDQLEKMIMDWKISIEILNETSIKFGMESCVESILDQAAALRSLSNILNNDFCAPDLQTFVDSISGELSLRTAKAFEHACRRLFKNFNDLFEGDMPDGTKLVDKYMKRLSVLHCFNDLVNANDGHSWKQVGIQFSLLITDLTHVLTKRAGECDAIARTAVSYGLRDGQRDASSLVVFEKCQGFDDYLPQEQSFVRNCTSAIKLKYEERGNSLKTCVQDTLKTAERDDCNGGLNRANEISNLKQLFQEIDELARFGKVTGSAFLCDIDVKVGAMLDSYTLTRIKAWPKLKLCWEKTIIWSAQGEKYEVDEVCQLIGMINNSLAEIAAVMVLCKNPKSRSSISQVNEEISELLIKFNKNVSKQVRISARFPEVANVLRTVKALEQYPLKSEHLPSFENLVALARGRVSDLADKIESVVEETAEIEKAEQLLSELRGAQTLDEFIGPDLSGRLGILSKLLVKKEEAVDDLLVSMIEKKDFRGMKDFLEPLSKTKAQIRRRKYSEYQSTIAESLKPVETALLHLIQKPTTAETLGLIAEKMKILSNASSEIGPLLKVVYDVTTSSKMLVTKIRGKVSKFLDRFEAGEKKFDLLEMGKALRLANLYYEYLKQFFSLSLESRQKRCDQAYSKLSGSMESRVDDFVATQFQKEGNLSILLKNLRSAGCSEMKDLGHLHKRTITYLNQQINEVLLAQKEFVAETECYAESIESLHALERALRNGLQEHIGHSFKDEINQLLRLWTEARQRQEQEMDFGGPAAPQNLENWAKRLASVNISNSSGSITERFVGSIFKVFNRQYYLRSYQIMQGHLRKSSDDRLICAERSLKCRDYVHFQEHVQILVLMETKIGDHIDSISLNIKLLKTKVQSHFHDLCEDVITALRQEECVEFERLFPDYRDCLLEAHCLDTRSNNVKNNIKLIHQLVFEMLEKKVKLVLQRLETFEFREIEAMVIDGRSFGHFVADHFSLLREQIISSNRIPVDPWLDDLMKLIDDFFHAGRYLGGIKHCAVLKIVPSSTLDDVRKAFRTRSREYHPDMCKDSTRISEFTEKFQKLNQASEELERLAMDLDGSQAQPFDKEIRGINGLIRKSVKEALMDQNYDFVESLYFRFEEIGVLRSLVRPELDTQGIQESVNFQIKDHVQKVRNKIESAWSEKNYQELNHMISDLKLMEDKLSASLFGKSWNADGIVQTIQEELVEKAKEARCFLRDKKTARESRDDFRRCFMALGAVMVELPIFKDFAKRVMSDVLESCLVHDWGYGYLFEFGNSLQRDSDGVTSDEKRVAHMVLNEFSSFNDVMTMIWNEEVKQKPPEVTIPEICVQDLTEDNRTALEQEKQEYLSASFKRFDMLFQSLLCDYLKPDADIGVLVRKTVAITENLKPVTCKTFGTQTKEAIPDILAGVFTIFTVLKSGESYNRLEQSSGSDEVDAMKVLMRPHNIQIQALLAMFGCEDPSLNSLQSQLMQIRTGEGKSMILGAASLVFSLLGFNVRCVCYSEYLSKRDYDAFRDVFEVFGHASSIKYSKITTLSEDSTARKGDLRELTLSLLRGEDRGKEPFPRVTKSSSDPANDFGAPLGPSLKGSTEALNERPERKSWTDIINSPDICSPSDHKAVDAKEATIQKTETRSSISRPKCDAFSSASKARTTASSAMSASRLPSDVCSAEQILLIDEVDVFFSSEFYGNTYNKAAMLREPEVIEILKVIWMESNEGKKRVKLSFVKQIPAYMSLVQKLSGFEFVVENEVMRMLDEVRRLDESPYHLDVSRDKIGHKVMDTIDYDVNFGYRTIFAYLKEKDKLQHPDATLRRELGIKLSCGQFSYANITPSAILGVSGTLEVMGTHEKDVLRRYGVRSFFYLPSVYGDSRFCFDKGDPSSVCIEKGTNDYFQKISEVVVEVTMNKRAAIVFFGTTERLNQFTSSPFFRKLGRNKNILKEDMTTVDKEFIIQRAATSGQITICTAAFGRGTDFFCKDETVEANGGVHVVQAFLPSELSEEIQIQGRTARQGKKGTFSMVLLNKDLQDNFGVNPDGWARRDYYKMLNEARKSRHDEHCKLMESNLTHATARDKASHEYFDALLDGAQSAPDLFKRLYLSIKKRPAPEVIDLDLCIALDNTGSMRPYRDGVKSTIRSLIHGQNSFLPKLQMKFPDTKFKIRYGLLAYKDIDDGHDQFKIATQPFCEDSHTFLTALDGVISNPSGGRDICEDHLGALHFLSGIDRPGCWESGVKVLLLFTDAPCHGFLPPSYPPSADAYSVRHPLGITPESVAGEMLKKEIDLFICSLNHDATLPFEETFSEAYFEHSDNLEERRIISVPLVQKGQRTNSSMPSQTVTSKHIIFVLDESGSMGHDWGGVVVAYNNYRKHRLDQQFESDLVSVVQFDDSARVTVQHQAVSSAPSNLSYHGGGTCFSPAATTASSIILSTPSTHAPLVVFMSDGMANDSRSAANIFSNTNSQVKSRFGEELELHVIGFGGGTDTSQLNEIARSSKRGMLHTTSNVAALSSVFVQIAGGSNVANVLEKEIGKRIYDAVTDRLSAEYAS